MVVSGFPWETPSEEVEKKITEVVQLACIKDLDTVTTRKHISFAFVTFKDIQTKKEFKKWLAGSEDKILYKGAHGLRVGDNEDRKQRARGRAIGKVKRALCEFR